MKIAKILSAVLALALLVGVLAVTGLAEGNIAEVIVWNEGSLTAVTSEKTDSTLTLVNPNTAQDWWKVKVELPRAITAGKTYEAVFKFTSDVTGPIKYSANDVSNYITSNEHQVVVGENTFVVRFVGGNDTYNCLELGGLGNCTLVFTEISLTEVTEELPEDHKCAFVNGKCVCGADNGFGSVSVWTEGSLTAVTREDTESTMKLTNTNDPADWWKVKVELPRFAQSGKTYEATFKFTANTTGTIKYNLDGAAEISGNEYNVVNGGNTFTVRFTAGSDTYNCLELGGLGKFELVFSEISVKEVTETSEDSGETPKTGDNVPVAVAVALVSALSVVALVSKKEF